MAGGLTRDGAIAALEGNLWSMWRQFGDPEGCLRHDEPALLRFETPLAHVPYNSVMRSHLDGPGADDRIDEVLAGYDRRGVPVMWVVHPTARPGDLAARLTARGLEQAEVVVGMVRRLDDLPDPGPPPAGITVEEVGPGGLDPYLELLTWRYALPSDAAPTLAAVMSAGRFGEPGSANRAWYAHDGEQVVCKACIHTDGAVAGLYGLATHTGARTRGLGRLLTLRAFGAARATGAELAVLHATPMAVALYRALGFEVVADFGLWTRPGMLHL